MYYLTNFKPSNTKKLEALLEPTREYTITHLDTANHRGSKQQFIKLKEYPDEIFKANEFLHKAFNKKQNQFLY